MTIYGHVYKYTNTINGKWYIGSHDGKKPNYRGSGTAFKRAKKKYGIDAFVKEILYEGPEFREQEDIILVELDAAGDPMSYNLKNAAIGGATYGMLNKIHSDEAREKMSGPRGKQVCSDAKRLAAKKASLIAAEKKRGVPHSEAHKKKISENNVGFTGRKHSEETRRKMKESHLRRARKA